MASGKRFKFHGSQIKVMTGYTADSPNPTISAITAADPAVVTSTGHALTDGDVVRLSLIVGMTELNGELFVVNNSTNNTFELSDVDSTDYTAYASGGVIEVAAFSNFCELTGYNQQGGSKPETPATSLCSTAAEYELGLQDFGTTQIDFNFAQYAVVPAALSAFERSGDKMAVHVILPKNGGNMVQLGFVQQQGVQSAVGGIWTASVTIRNTGARVDLAAV